MNQTHITLKKTIRAFIVAFIVWGTIPVLSIAQVQPSYVIIELMKVEPENESMYLEVEQKLWKQLHQARIDNGNIAGWILYRIRFTGTDDAYNYATATVFDNAANIEDPYKGLDMQEVLPEVDQDEAMRKTMDSRTMVKSHLIRRINFAYPENNSGPAPFKYLHVNYVKVKPASGYPYVANTIWKPILQEYVNQGTRAAWSLWQAVYPRGFEEDYQFVAVDYFSEWSQIGTSDFNAAFQKVHAGKDPDVLMKQTRESRSIVRTELWEVVDMVMAEQ